MSEQSVQAGLAGGCGDRAVGQPIAGRSASVSRVLSTAMCCSGSGPQLGQRPETVGEEPSAGQEDRRRAPDRADLARGRPGHGIRRCSPPRTRRGQGQDLSSDRPALAVVGVEQRLNRGGMSGGGRGEGQLPAEVRSVLHAGVHALAAGRRVDVCGVPRDERPGAKRSARRCWSGMHADQGAAVMVHPKPARPTSASRTASGTVASAPTTEPFRPAGWVETAPRSTLADANRNTSPAGVGAAWTTPGSRSRRARGRRARPPAGIHGQASRFRLHVGRGCRRRRSPPRRGPRPHRRREGSRRPPRRGQRHRPRRRPTRWRRRARRAPRRGPPRPPFGG